MLGCLRPDMICRLGGEYLPQRSQAQRLSQGFAGIEQLEGDNSAGFRGQCPVHRAHASVAEDAGYGDSRRLAPDGTASWSRGSAYQTRRSALKAGNPSRRSRVTVRCTS